MSSLAFTSITNFILAAEALFLAGTLAGIPKARFSAAWYWTGTLLLLGLGALIGGIDHGFIEPSNQPRYFIQRADWIVLGAMTFCVLTATAKQFFPPRVQRIVLVLGAIQFVANTIVVLLVDSFLAVTLNYAPVMILLLSMNSVRLKSGAGSWQMSAGILVLFAATGIQALGVDYFSPLDHNGLYHLATMIGVLFLYAGGRRLKGYTDGAKRGQTHFLPNP
jgi:hypothetical protein